jgi:quercetin dioxygenase-like cupin family protein
VLQGNIEVVVGEHVNALGPGDSLHFNSGIQHLLRNTGETDAELIVVIYNP